MTHAKLLADDPCRSPFNANAYASQKPTNPDPQNQITPPSNSTSISMTTLSSLFYLKVTYRVVGLWLWIVGLWLRIVIGVSLWVVGISSLFYLELPIRCSSFSEHRFAVLSLKVSSIHREPSWFHRFVLRQGCIFVLAIFRYWIWKLEPLPLIGLVFLN